MATMNASIEQEPMLKRKHVDEEETGEYEAIIKPSVENDVFTKPSIGDLTSDSNVLLLSPPNTTIVDRLPSLAPSSASELSERTTTPAPPENYMSHPNAFSALSGNPAPPKKKVKLSFQAKEEARIMKEIRDREKQEERERKEQDKKAKEVEKAKKDAEREAERLVKEVEREEKRVAKEAERAIKEEQRRAKEAEKKKKEEEKARAEEEKKKREGAQNSITRFFGQPVVKKETTVVRPKVARAATESNSASASASTPEGEVSTDKPAVSYYEATFFPFFVGENVKLAEFHRFQRDPESLRLLNEKLDACLDPERMIISAPAFNGSSLFHIPDSKGVRGRQIQSVREIFAEPQKGDSSHPIDLTTESQNTRVLRIREQLRKVPYKIIDFPKEDVRPAYRGTYTSAPLFGSLSQLARRPCSTKGRVRPDTNYDYDSEAEWEEPQEGEEDLDDLMTDEEEKGDDDDEDMEGFLDDEEDELARGRRMVVQDLEPVSSGLCWEDRRAGSPELKLYAYKMCTISGESRFLVVGHLCRFGIGSVAFRRLADSHFDTDAIVPPIDPWTASYWAPVTATTTMQPPRVPLHALKANSATNNSITSYTTSTSQTKPSKSSTSTSASRSPSPLPGAQPASSTPSSASTASTAPKKSVKQEDMPSFMQTILENRDLTKAGMLEFLAKRFQGNTRQAVMNSLELVARRDGKGKQKLWRLV